MHQTWVQFGSFSGTDPDSGTTYEDEEDFHVVDEPSDVDPDLVIDGPSAALVLWLWNRGDDAEISAAGDREILDRLRTVIGQPIN